MRNAVPALAFRKTSGENPSEINLDSCSVEAAFSLESKLCCFIENLYYSSKYNFHDLRLKALRDDSLYLTLSRNISINMFVDEEDFEAERDSNEEEIFLSYSKNGKDYITCDSISNIISIIEDL